MSTIIIITFDNYTERLPEVVGPFDDHAAAESWLNDLIDSGQTENPSSDLSAASFIITKASEPWDIAEMARHGSAQRLREADSVHEYESQRGTGPHGPCAVCGLLRGHGRHGA